MAIKGLVAIPTPGDCARHTSFYEFLLQLNKPEGTAVFLSRGASVAENRNLAAAEGLAQGAEWVFYLDDDMSFQPDILTRLLSHNVPMVSALYCFRQAPFRPMVFKEKLPDGRVFPYFLSSFNQGVQECEAVGAGALLVRREVFEKLENPWFTLGQLKADTWGDDLHFCHKVRSAGIPIHCDFDTFAGHLSVLGVWPFKTPTGKWETALIQQGMRFSLPAATPEMMQGGGTS